MKKFSVVLLVAVLAVSSVFAGLSGYVTAKYVIDFDNGTFAYTDPDTSLGDLEAKISFDTLNAAKKGKGNVYVDAAASFSWTAEGISDDTRYSLSRLGYFQLALDKLNIVGSDWTWNLTEAELVGGFADSTLDFHTWYRHDHMKGSKVNDGDKFENGDVTGKYKDDYSKYAKKVAYGANFDFEGDDDIYGTTFKKGGYTVALAANGHVGDFNEKKNQIFYLGAETKEYELGDVVAQFAAGVAYKNTWDSAKSKLISDDAWTIGASAQAAYAAEKFSVSVATDQFMTTQGTHTSDGKGENVTPEYNGDVLAKVKFAPVSAEVFFGKEAKSKKGDDKGYKYNFGVSGEYDVTKNSKIDTYQKNSGNKKYFSTQGLYGDDGNTVKNLLSFQVAADLNEFDIPVKVTFQGLNMVNDAKIFNVKAAVDFENVKLNLYGLDLLASYDKLYSTSKEAYYQKASAVDKGSYNYWDENGNKQKVGFDATVTVNDALTATAGFYTKFGAREIGANLGATYKADLFTATASAEATFSVASDADYTQMKGSGKPEDAGKLRVIVGATSDKLVDGALLSIEYKSGNLLDTPAIYDWQAPKAGEFAGTQAGKLTTKCKVTF